MISVRSVCQSVCVSVCLSVQAITFELLKLGTSLPSAYAGMVIISLRSVCVSVRVSVCVSVCLFGL